MSSDSSMDSAEKAESDRKVDEYFPRPGEKPFVTSRGYKAITTTEEKDLLARGIMTYYRGHLDSRCCEACDHALRSSDRYARQTEELRPVGVHKHKYIDKSRAGCGVLREVSKAPPISDIKTGFTAVVTDDVEKMVAAHNKYNRDQHTLDSLYALQKMIEPFNEASAEYHSPKDIWTFMINMKNVDFKNLFFNYSEINKENVKKFKLDVANVITNVRHNLLDSLNYDESGVQYGISACLILIMFLECTEREGVRDQLDSYLNTLNVSYRSKFRKMVRELSKLPVYKEPVRKAAKVRFNQSESNEPESNEEFKKKRKMMDSCPREVTGTTIIDIYDLPTFDEE